jgi:cytochrome oxidase Cu insertion factor (SCO1/SenC/PrrC family)
MSRSVYIGIVVTGVLLSVAAIFYQQRQEVLQEELVAEVIEKAPIGQVAIGGSYELVDHQGNRRTDKDFKGSYHLVYFGYSYCPDICPMALHNISEALTLLGDSAKNVLPIFITVDPERDTSWHLNQYLKNYHPSFVGLTGSYAEIQHAIAQYHVYATKVESSTASDYLMDHSSIIYLMDPQGRYVTHCNHNTAPEEIVLLVKAAMR